MKGDPAQSYLGWAFFRMEKDWTLPLGYASKLNFPDGTPIAFTDSMPIVAVAMKAISKRLPSTFQYLGLIAFANYLLQAFFGYKIGFAILKDRLLAALAGAFFTLAPPFVLRTGFHFSLSSQWLILATLWLYLRFDQGRATERTTVLWFCVLFLFAGGITPYIAVLCVFVAWQPFCLRLSERAATGRAGPLCGWRRRWCCFFPGCFLDSSSWTWEPVSTLRRAIATTR